MFKVIAFFITILLFSPSLHALEKPLEKVSLQLQWIHQFQFAGYYMAKEKGFYKDVGIDLEIREWQHGIDVAKELREGRAEYGIARPTILLNKLDGDDVFLLAAIFQSSPLVVITTKSSGIKKLEDFKDKSIMSVLDSRDDVAIKAMLGSKHIYFKDMNLVEHSFNVKDLVNGKVDLMTAYRSDQPYLLKEIGVDAVVFDPKSYGFDFYSDMLFTCGDEREEHPLRMKNFTEASLKGWKYAFEHIDESIELILKKYNGQNKSKEALLFEAKELKKLAYYQTANLGLIEKAKLEKILYVYKLLGMTNKDISLDDFIYQPALKRVDLNLEEKMWIKEHPVVSYSEVDWKPLSIIEEGKMKGIMGEYLDLVAQKTGLSFKYVPASSWPEVLDKFARGEIDLVPGIGSSAQERSLGLISNPYATYPMAIVTGDKYRYVNNLSELSQKVIAVPKHFTSYNFLVKNHPEIRLNTTTDIKEALRLVDRGEADAFVGHIATSLYYTSELFLKNLKISGTTDFNFEHRYLVQSDNAVLLSIVNKTFASISEEDRVKINATWVHTTVEQKKDYTFLINVLMVLSFITFIIVMWNYRLKSLVNKKTQELQEFNTHLEEIVHDRTEKLELTSQRLQELADHDPLTNLYNRRYLLNISQELFSLARRNGEHIAIVMLDIDHFKQINDKYGHSVGDDIIMCVVKKLSLLVRESDIVARYGGEEFVVLLPNTDAVGARLISEKIREAIAEDVHCSAGQEIKFTASFGVGEVDLHNDNSIDEVLKRADKALYQAKDKGRNLVCCY